MVSNHAVYGKYQVCQIRRGSDVATGNKTPSTLVVVFLLLLVIELVCTLIGLSNNPFIRVQIMIM